MARFRSGCVSLSFSRRQYSGLTPPTNALGLKAGALYSASTSPVLGLSATTAPRCPARSEEHTSELQSRPHLVCRLLLEKKKKKTSEVRVRAECTQLPRDERCRG